MIRVVLEEGRELRKYALSDLSDIDLKCPVPAGQQWYIIAVTIGDVWYMQSQLRTYVVGSTHNHEKTKMPELHLDGLLLLACDGKEYIDNRRIVDFGKFDLRKEIKK